MLDKLLKDKVVKLKRIPSGYAQIFEQYQNHNADLYQAIFTFTHTLDEMKNEIFAAIDQLENDGLLFLCYPKIKNKLGLAGIHRDHIFPFLEVDEETGYVKNTLMRFNRMVAFDENYTLLAVKKDFVQRKRSATSQRVDDYVAFIDNIKAMLKNEQCYSFFISLTPGYQKNWARYIF